MRRLAPLLLALLAPLFAACANDVPVLLYHFVGAGTDLPWETDVEAFRAQMDELKARGYETVSLAELFDHRDGTGPLPARPVVLTFDDGDLSLHQHVLPILRERGMRAELFLVTEFIREREEDRFVWMRGENRVPMLVWPEVRELVASGVFSIGSHTRTHPRLADLPLENARDEIVTSRLVLEEKLGRRVPFFAYPGHSLNADVVALVEQAGYRGAVAGQNRLGQPFNLFRSTVYRHHTLDDFRALLSRNWVDAWSAPDEHHD